MLASSAKEQQRAKCKFLMPRFSAKCPEPRAKNGKTAAHEPPGLAKHPASGAKILPDRCLQ